MFLLNGPTDSLPLTNCTSRQLRRTIFKVRQKQTSMRKRGSNVFLSGCGGRKKDVIFMTNLWNTVFSKNSLNHLQRISYHTRSMFIRRCLCKRILMNWHCAEAEATSTRRFSLSLGFHRTRGMLSQPVLNTSSGASRWKSWDGQSKQRRWTRYLDKSRAEEDQGGC